MSLKLKDIVGDIFHTEAKEKAEEAEKTAYLQQKANNALGITSHTYNPFLKRDGSLLNPYINYQKVLDNPYTTSRMKKYIQDATGLEPTLTSNGVTKLSDRTSNNTTSKIKKGLDMDKINQYIALSKSKESASSSSTSATINATGNAIADAAQSYIGTPYVYGGSSTSAGGLDCSGFVYNTLKDVGYNIDRTSAQGYRSYGTAVSKSEMQPGDLVFYGKDGQATHVGIYIGNGQVIHSSGGRNNTASNPGKGVSVTNVDYRSDFLEVRRY